MKFFIKVQIGELVDTKGALAWQHGELTGDKMIDDKILLMAFMQAKKDAEELVASVPVRPPSEDVPS